ncbi:MAG TPA: response regulator [Candidatus Paceibacterota bacterium]
MTKQRGEVLIIEDDEEFGNGVVHALTEAGYKASWETDGAHGFAKMLKHPPDLILLDIMLPGMDGFGILEEKSKNKKVADIPVVVISDSMQDVEVNRAIELGAKEYMPKAGITPSDIVAKVATYLAEVNDTPVSDTKGLTGKHILLVEDEPFLRDLLTIKLTKLGCKLSYATDGDEAIAAIKAEKPDIVLLDLLLPSVSGFEVLDHIRKNSDTANIPVVVLSNLGEKKDVEKCQQLGATDFLIKAHHSIDEIIEKIQGYLA